MQKENSRLSLAGSDAALGLLKNPIFCLSLYFVLALCIMAWRWGGVTNDSLIYYRTALYFRGMVDINSLESPFSYRIMSSLIASMLPGDIRFNFGLLNFLSVVGSAYILRALMNTLGFSKVHAAVGGALVILSFPAFWYAPYCTVDPLALLFRTAMVYLLWKKQWTSAALIFCISVTVREDLLVMFLAATVWAIRNRAWRGLIIWGGSLAVALLVLLVVRWSFAMLPQYFWLPGLGWVQLNLTSPKRILSSLLGIGPAGLILPFVFVKRRQIMFKPQWREPFVFLATFLAIFSLVPMYGLLSAGIDARPFWHLYPALIPLGIIGAALLLYGISWSSSLAEEKQTIFGCWL